MKKWIAIGVTLLMTLALCACGNTASEPDDPNVGLYECTSVVMESMELGADGEYLDLQNGGKCAFFFYEEPDNGTWTLDGETLTISIPYSDMELNATGTLKDGVIVMTIPELGNATLTFQKQGIEAPAETAPAEGAAETPAGEAPAETAPVEEAPVEEVPAA